MSSSRPSRSRSFLLTTAALGVVVLGGWLALSLLLDPAHLQDELQRAVYKSTGRDLTIAGPVTGSD